MAKLLFSDTKNKDMYYMLGMDISDPVFFIDTGKKKYVFLDHREIGTFKKYGQNKEIEAVLLDDVLEEAKKKNKENVGSDQETALYLMEKYGLLDAEVEVADTFPLGLADFLRSKGIRLKVTKPLFPQRMIKNSEEIGKIRENLDHTKKAFQKIEEILEESVIEGDILRYAGEVLTSEILKREVRHSLVDRGMSDVEGLIISCGSDAAMPHHPGEGPIRPHRTIICDFFPRSRQNGYFADMTRTYVKGKASPEILRMYEAVAHVQQKAIDSIRAGVRGADVYKICVDGFLRLGHEVGARGFVHGTGHGLGLDIHEGPYLNARYDQQLESGNVVTVEPGLYYPEIGGVRIEDVVCVTEDGSVNLTDYPKILVIK